MKKTKNKIHITVIRCKATITPEIKSKEEQNYYCHKVANSGTPNPPHLLGLMA